MFHCFRLRDKYNLTAPVTNYESYIFRNETGHDVTAEADELYELYEEAKGKVEVLKKEKIAKNNEIDITVRKVF